MFTTSQVAQVQEKETGQQHMGLSRALLKIWTSSSSESPYSSKDQEEGDTLTILIKAANISIVIMNQEALELFIY